MIKLIILTFRKSELINYRNIGITASISVEDMLHMCQPAASMMVKEVLTASTAW